ncbi:PIN domain-containing protein [Anabaena sp. PCC 7938]|nr:MULTISPECIES: PIN domain-containing protein [Anabaena]MCM2404819.1 PIN domain-containing protein [Anabaena sp. CCAP 1446/1C]
MKVLLDTNIIIDIALERQPYVTHSETVLAFVEQRQIQG